MHEARASVSVLVLASSTMNGLSPLSVPSLEMRGLSAQTEPASSLGSHQITRASIPSQIQYGTKFDLEFFDHVIILIFVNRCVATFAKFM